MRLVLVGTAMLCGMAAKQMTGLQPVNSFPLKENKLAIRRHVEAGIAFYFAGTRGVVLGQQQGMFEGVDAAGEAA